MGEGRIMTLLPRVSGGAALNGIDGDLAVGSGIVDNRAHALLWTLSGPGAVNRTPTDLDPAGILYSAARDVSGTQVVGEGWSFQGGPHALLWPDATPDRVVDLHPAGYQYSQARATNGTQQTGYGVMSLGDGNSYSHPLLWSGTPGSVVDLLPPGAFGGDLWGISGDQQVGNVGFAGASGTHATLWTGTPESVVDLHPGGKFTYSYARDTNGRQQVGYGLASDADTTPHALLWNGDNHAIELEQFLPAGTITSYAFAIDEDGTIVGSYAFADGLDHPVKWVPLPDPAGCAVVLLPAALLSRARRGSR
jgi:uncharacterized membrane protein